MGFLAGALLIIATIHATKACTPGDTRQDDPNTCVCLDDGRGWTCAPVAGRCVPETIFKYYCNECICLDDGLAVNAFCTRLSCDHNIWNENGTRNYPEEDETNRPNDDNDHEEDHEDDLNNNSFQPYLINAYEKRERCHPGQIFINFCNYCVCGRDRTIAGSACTPTLCDSTRWNNDGTLKSAVAFQGNERTVETS